MNETQANALRAEYKAATRERQADIRLELARAGFVVFPSGTPEYEAYARKLRLALTNANETAALIFPNTH